jgi:hypothetical protein
MPSVEAKEPRSLVAALPGGQNRSRLPMKSHTVNLDQVWIQQDYIGLHADVLRRYAVLLPGLEQSTKKEHRLVQAIERGLRRLIGPQVIHYLVASGRLSAAGD